MKKLASLLILCFASVFLGAGCGLIPASTGEPTTATPVSTATTTIENPRLTSLVAELINSPQRAGEEVEIVGYFHGWDMLHEMESPPPVTRSDWVIADSSGAIYVTGLMPEGLDPSSPEQAGQVIRLVGTIRASQNQVYLETVSVEPVPEP